MGKLRDFSFVNNIVVHNRLITVDVYVSKSDGISCLKVNISNEDICLLTDGSIHNRIKELYDVIYPSIESMSNACDIILLPAEERLEVAGSYLVFKFYGWRKEQ